LKRNAGIGTATTASTSTKNTNNPILSTKNGINKEDLIQEGMIGLTYAIDKFDLSRNVNFSTYAMYWIEGRIMRYIKMKSNFVHIPEYMQDIIYKVERKVYDMDLLFWENVDTTTTTNDNNNNKSSNVHSGMDDNDHFTKMENMILQDESKMRFLCNELGYDRQTIMNAFKVRRTMYNTKSNSIVELEDWMSRATRTTTSAIITADTTPDIAAMNTLANDVDRNSDSQVVLERYQNILGQFISMKEMEALSWRYGLLNKEEEQEQTIQSSTSSSSVNGRDYEAEAEYDLFGPGGILNNSNMNNAKETTVSTIAPIVQTPQPVSINTQSKAKITIRSGGTSSTISQPSTKASFTLSNKGGRWGEAMSFNEVGEQMRVSAEYGRRLCASALKKLTKAVDEGRLDPAMLF
jgi:RNA polymerase sigma factor (sigma-70 family)